MSVEMIRSEDSLPLLMRQAMREWTIPRLRLVLGMLDRSLGRHASTRYLAILLAYSGGLALSFYVAYEMRWDFQVPPELAQQRLSLILPVVICKLILLHSFGQFRSILSYFGLADFAAIGAAIATVSGLMLMLWYASEVMAAPSRGVILMDFVVGVALLSAFRLTLRVTRSWSNTDLRQSSLRERRLAILGAGDVGEALAKELLQRRGGLMPVIFVDDNLNRVGRSIHGLPVIGPIEKLTEVAPRLGVNEIVITSEPGPRRIREIVELGRQIGASAHIVPSARALASGQVKIDRSRPVAIEDLLGREPVNLDSAGISRLLADRVVMVTGAGGSIGSELCRQILAHRPARLVMVEQAEIALFEIEQELIERTGATRLGPLIVDVTDEAAMRAIFAQHRPEIIFHAAAHKHVPLMERQPAEAIKNNTLGTATLARLADEYEVDRLVLISTDKAINPTSVMGCSKRLAEKVLQAQQRRASNETKFLAVRFGNVLGSSGSVIPTFRRQIAQGGPLTVTHAEMTRYFMTIPEAVGLVLQAAALGQGGEIFILDMGQPVRIVDMARQMIELSGYKPDVDIEIKFTGLRPGEKLFEELRHAEETHRPTEHPRIFELRGEGGGCAQDNWLDELRAAAESGSPAAMKQLMKRLVPEYTPFVD